MIQELLYDYHISNSSQAIGSVSNKTLFMCYCLWSMKDSDINLYFYKSLIDAHEHIPIMSPHSPIGSHNIISQDVKQDMI